MTPGSLSLSGHLVGASTVGNDDEGWTEESCPWRLQH